MFSIRAKQMEDYPVDPATNGLEGVDAKKMSTAMPSLWSFKTVMHNPLEYTMIALGVVIGIVGTFCEFYSCFTSN